MKLQEHQAVANAAAAVDSIAKFEVTEIGSITVTANLLRSNPGGQQPSVAIRVFEEDPRFAQLEAMIRDHATAQKADAQKVLTDAGVSITVDPTEVAAARDDSVAAKAELEALKERNAIKHAVLKAQEEAKAGKSK